ncbi:Hypothetical protein SMAX5B_015328 [Scophthalmus maximus]|uniref:Uncharacterized protein n=1 Tax=Scophthalmus maximus TaxID=52904 RepID=A0A2U9C7L4_SCOMX|nr:Hypothetical protein SMAX5B_015328 [Scophthalmus maximus]
MNSYLYGKTGRLLHSSKNYGWEAFGGRKIGKPACQRERPKTDVHHNCYPVRDIIV